MRRVESPGSPRPVDSKTTRRAPGRPRSEECRTAILDAAADLLDEVPYAKVTIESIAARAGCSKQTIYKWWKSRALLVMQAYAARQRRKNPEPDTGAARRDLLTVIRQTCRLLRGGGYGETVSGIIAEAQSDAELAAEFRETFIGERRAIVTRILERGIARGELRHTLDIPLVIDLLYGPIWYRLLLQHAPLDDAFAEKIVEHVLEPLRTMAALS